ncbi:MAG: phospho-N-acetylmuramoyl-pentapeptide-transferase [Treponema sp. GWB1_62_6]|nr:MAG: phospho-N-acetylmuramoyl-pentapeptide-transferase [Treponema sp. GWB1_62_6]OHE63931.1 MAG: phospho-N-acetylmuramoyl-pentapeptide-transferase [Treponema sp. GWC1_61_84]OHE76693.1 MAG: phospho-N-acetylmuramoyl-pentapeptide-transferase [Treponema sp. RIFOXYC1_FULL_61_9]HCM25253.1 phospho-N-acetylmuramoyl-pentapeptide-transferase [Treponema sp.]
MFLKFLYPMVKLFTPFNVFRYLTFRGAYAALTALLICFLFGPRIIEALRLLKVGQSIRDDGPRTHLKKGGTPTMGGILVIFAVTVAVLLWQDLGNFFGWLTLAAFVGFGLIGFLDDYLKVSKKNSDGLPAWAKLVGQFAIAIAVSVTLYLAGDERTTYLYLPFFKNPVIDLGILWIPFAVLLLVGESNAVNLTDGLDGLATGLVIMVFITLSVLTYLSGRADYSSYLGIPYIRGAGELTVLCLSMVGASVGFLWFNAHPAEVFMGDVGSLAFGGAIATISLVIKKEILVLIVGGVFVLEAASVMIQVVSFKLRKKRVFRMAPLHHHFELSGWAETKVVTRFWILGGLFAIVALSTLKTQ